MTHIEQRIGSAAEWTSVNPVLFEGEAGHETDTGKWKLGDGITDWVGLAYKPGVMSVAGKTGIVTLDVSDVTDAAPLASPAFTGSPTAPTPNPADNDTSIATTAFVKSLDYASVAILEAAITGAVAAAMLALHPVGSIYTSTAPTNPGTFIGGTWEVYAQGRVLVGIDAADPTFDTVGETVGVKDVTLSAAQSGLVGHSHGVNDPGHAHSQTIDSSYNAGRSGAGPNDYAQNNTGANGVGGGFNTGGSASNVSIQAVPSAAASAAHTNLQPSIVVHMFRRTA